MSDLFLLSERQMARISPFFPLSHGVPRVDDRRVVSGIVYVIRHGLQLEGRAQGLWPAQDALQSLHALERDGRLRPHLRRAGRRRAQLNVLHRHLDDFRVEVARIYVTDRSMRECEERISAAIERLGHRSDRLIERSPRGR